MVDATVVVQSVLLVYGVPLLVTVYAPDFPLAIIATSFIQVNRSSTSPFRATSSTIGRQGLGG